MEKKYLTLVVIGYGSRADTYTKFFKENPSTGTVVAVAEPNDARRTACQNYFSIESSKSVTSWELLLNKEMGKIADMCLIATLDRMHLQPALAAIELGYDIILEKPMGVTVEECWQICKAVKDKGVNMY